MIRMKIPPSGAQSGFSIERFSVAKDCKFRQNHLIEEAKHPGRAFFSRPAGRFGGKSNLRFQQLLFEVVFHLVERLFGFDTKTDGNGGTIVVKITL